MAEKYFENERSGHVYEEIPWTATAAPVSHVSLSVPSHERQSSFFKEDDSWRFTNLNTTDQVMQTAGVRSSYRHTQSEMESCAQNKPQQMMHLQAVGTMPSQRRGSKQNHGTGLMHAQWTKPIPAQGTELIQAHSTGSVQAQQTGSMYDNIQRDLDMSSPAKFPAIESLLEGANARTRPFGQMSGHVTSEWDSSSSFTTVSPLPPPLPLKEKVTRQPSRRRVRVGEEAVVIRWMKISDYGIKPEITNQNPEGGFDIYSAYECRISPYNIHLVCTDIIMTLPTGVTGYISTKGNSHLPPSILTWRTMIPSKHKDDIKVALFNSSDREFVLHRGVKIASVILAKSIISVLEQHSYKG